MLRLDAERPEDGGRKILEVECDDDVGMASEGGRQHMPIIGVRKIETWNQRFVVGDEAVLDRRIHEGAGPLKP